jgi:excisionase family DNA binding protein
MDALIKEILDAIRATIRQELRFAGDEYLTIREASKLSSLSVPTVRLYVRLGKIKARRAGRRVIISRKDLEEFINQGVGGSNAKTS